MSGTKEGGKKAAATNIKRHGKDFYRIMGRKGGQAVVAGKGFASEKVGRDGLTGYERAKIAGTIGGFVSRRGKAKRKDESE